MPNERPTDKELREHLEACKTLNAEPCDCILRGLEHSLRCAVGRALAESTIKTLEWVLGCGDMTHTDFVNRTNERAAKVRHENAERRKKRGGK